MLDFNGEVGVAFKLSATDDTDFAVLHNQSLRSALDWSGCSLRHYLCLIYSDLVRFSNVRESGTIFYTRIGLDYKRVREGSLSFSQSDCYKLFNQSDHFNA